MARNLLNLEEVSKAFDIRALLERVSLGISEGDRIGIVGRNGSGKSTLMKIMSAAETPDSGRVTKSNDTRIGLLSQVDNAPAGATVRDVVLGNKPTHEWASDAGIREVFTGLFGGFDDHLFERTFATLSGGERRRVGLAKLLIDDLDLVLLDEPTNHLDLMSLLWFRQYLKNYPGAILMISHDRDFMDEIVQTVYEIDGGKLNSYTGNYSKFQELKEAAYERALIAYRNQRKEIENLEEFIDRFRSVASKSAQAQSRERQLEKMDKLDKPRPLRKAFRFNFPQPQRSGQRVIALTDIYQAYGEKKIYQGLDLEIEKGERTVLVGPNGAGKSTLIKIMAGVVPFQKGDRKFGTNVKMGYFSQHRSDTLDPECTILEELKRCAPELREDDARSILGSFLFKREDVHKRCKILSGGEKSRLNLVKFLVDPPNLLLMDEPTTHLDIWAIEGLILALQKFEGTLVFISHDVHFIRSIATKVLHISSGVVTPYSGGYDYYLEKTGAEENARAAVIAE